jgi:hypothetical protein
VFDLNDPTAGLGAVGAFKNLANWTQRPEDQLQRMQSVKHEHEFQK